MRWHLPTLHMPRAHAMHLHPSEWVHEHPLAILMILLGILALSLVVWSLQSGASIRPEKLDMRFPASYPFGPVY